MFHDIIVKSTLFMVGGVLYRIFGSTKLKDMGELMDSHPKLSLLFVVPLFAVVGIPPLSGFWPKVSLFLASYETGNIFMTLLFIFASIITLVIIAKIWNHVFSKSDRHYERHDSFRYFKDFNIIEKSTYIIPIIILVSITLYYSFFAENFQVAATRIGEELMNTEHYYNAVFGINK